MASQTYAERCILYEGAAKPRPRRTREVQSVTASPPGSHAHGPPHRRSGQCLLSTQSAVPSVKKPPAGRGWRKPGGLTARLLRMVKLRLDEDHQRLGQHAVMGHRFGRPFGLHRSHENIHIGHIHEHRYPGRVLRVDEPPDVGDPERPEELLALCRGKPAVLVLHIVVANYGWHGSPRNLMQRMRLTSRTYTPGTS